MPFLSKVQMRAAFGGHLGPEMKKKARKWAHETKNIDDLPERKKKRKKHTKLPPPPEKDA